MTLQHCTQEDRKIIGDCLRATVEGPFFPEWEFHILFGLTRAEVARVLQSGHRWTKATIPYAVRCMARSGSLSAIPMAKNRHGINTSQ